MKKLKYCGIFFGIFCVSFILSGQEIKKVNVPTVSVSTVKVPSLSLSMPVLPATIAPEVVQEKVQVPETGKTDTEVPETENPVAYVPETTDRNTPLEQGKLFSEVKKKLFRDQRGLLHDRTANSSNSAFLKWVQIFRKYQKQFFAAYPLPAGIRMIAEVQVNKDLSLLPENLEFYKNKGYNSVLFVINGKETAQDAEKVCKIITGKGLKLFFAFSPKDHDGELSASVFPDPDKLSDILRITALYADGFLLHWRRTSSHYFLHDPAWDDWMIKTVRTGKSNLPILGEIYLGTNAESNDKVIITNNAPSGISGNVLNGGGFYGVSASGLIREAKKLSPMPLFALILGEKPRYLQKTKKSFADHLKIKENLEKQYIKNGCSGTITLHSDTSSDDLTVWQNH